MARRPELNVAQSWTIWATIALCFFLGAAGLGSWSVYPAFGALGVAIVGAILALVLGRLGGSGRSVTAEVLSIDGARPTAESATAPASMLLRIYIDGEAFADGAHDDPAVPADRWPRVGARLPVVITSRGRIKVRWREVPRSSAPVPVPVAAPGLTPVRVHTEFAEPIDLAQPIGPAEPIDPAQPIDLAEFPLDEVAPDEFAEPIEFAPPTPPVAPPVYAAEAIVLSGTIVDPEQTLRVEPAPFPPAQPDPPAPAPPPPPPAPPAPTSAPAAAAPDLPTRERPAPGRPAPAPRSPVEGGGVGVMLVVSDLARSVRFYGELLGFEIVDASQAHAVLSRPGGGRLILQEMRQMPPVDRRVVHLQIQVTDLDATYRELVERGVEFSHRPRVLSSGDRLELRVARLRDPDGHAIALTEERDRMR